VIDRSIHAFHETFWSKWGAASQRLKGDTSPNQSLVGFLEVGLRSHADGCDPAQPVGYVEGWFVAPDHRGQVRAVR